MNATVCCHHVLVLVFESLHMSYPFHLIVLPAIAPSYVISLSSHRTPCYCTFICHISLISSYLHGIICTVGTERLRFTISAAACGYTGPSL